MGQKKKYSVWVGGVEVNDFLLTLDEAQDLANEYRKMGYSNGEIYIDEYIKL